MLISGGHISNRSIGKTQGKTTLTQTITKQGIGFPLKLNPLELTCLPMNWASLTAMFLSIHSEPGLGMYCKACCKITAALCTLAEMVCGGPDESDGFIASATTCTCA